MKPNLLPVLQIIHITDLHFKHVTSNAVEPLYAKRRFAARLLQNRIESSNWFDWNEGTQGHYSWAPESFRRFLVKWREDDPRWYARSPTEDSAATWLVDTGDLTAFGNKESIVEGKAWLDIWAEAAGALQVRSIYGNHDAWPTVHPALALLGGMQDELNVQYAIVRNQQGWRQQEWISQPCTIAIPGTSARIELYALNSVCWNAWENIRAVGRLSAEDIESLREALRARWSREDNKRHFRILATHHPIAFPYEPGLNAIATMRLLYAEDCARELKNDRGDPKGLGPLVHLMLSGHTHVAYPSGPLCSNASEIYQGQLGPNQLQLVGGPLMLNKDLATMMGRTSSLDVAKAKGFSIQVSDARNCQAQILQLHSDVDNPGQLVMYRTPVWSEDGSTYTEDQPSKPVRFAFDSPLPR